MGRVLDLSKRGEEGDRVYTSLRKRIVGQDDALRTMLHILNNFKAGFNDPSRPAGNAFLLGPTGTGKTHTIESICDVLFGSTRACIKIDCAEFQHSHEIAKLIGSPPGYLGHRETHPMLTQEALNAYHTPDLPLSVVLFDEIEKASDALWQLLLGVLDKATLTLGDNRKVDFKNTIIVMTSNIAAAAMQALTEGGMGFASQAVMDSVLHARIEETAIAAAKRKFSPEFYNRLDNVVVFRTLTKNEINEVLSMELGRLQRRLLFHSKNKFYFNVDQSARNVLLHEGYDKVYNARHIKRAIERKLVIPLAQLVSSGQIGDQDVIMITDKGGEYFNFEVVGDKTL